MMVRFNFYVLCAVHLFCMYNVDDNVDSRVSIKARLINAPVFLHYLCAYHRLTLILHIYQFAQRAIFASPGLTLARHQDDGVRSVNTQYFVANVLLEAQEMNRHQQYVTLRSWRLYLHPFVGINQSESRICTAEPIRGRTEFNITQTLLCLVCINTKYLDSSYRYRCQDLQIQNVTDSEEKG